MSTTKESSLHEHPETEYEERSIYRGSFTLAAADGLPIGQRNLSMEDLRVIDEEGWISTSVLRSGEKESIQPSIFQSSAKDRAGEFPTHSSDFTSVNWFGTRYRFSKGNQAESVRVLWEAWEAGEFSLSQETIGEEIGSHATRFELRKTFRQRKVEGRGFESHPAWGTMIQSVGKGCYRLVKP